MANYVVDPRILEPYLPCRTEIDLWSGKCYVSLVGFMFLNTKLRGFKIPFHSDFEEVNLRFYVRYEDKGEWKRGVVFIKEIVPRPALTFVANTVYGENYETMPMAHSWENIDGKLEVKYSWKKNKAWNSFKVIAQGAPTEIITGSEEEFITEHYWGYTRNGETATAEYGVEHPRWDVYPVIDYNIDVDFDLLYGKSFEFLKDETPTTVFLAEGSEIRVMGGKTICR